MKFVLTAVAACLSCAAFSEGASGKLMTNGEVEIEDVNSIYVANRTFVQLNEDESSCVSCQVFYRDEEEDLEQADEFIIEEMDRWVNEALERYLHRMCRGMALDQLVAGCRDGSLYERLSTFPGWTEDILDKINEKDDCHRRRVSIVSVIIKPFGEFAERVGK